MVRYWTVFEDMDRAEQERDTVLAFCYDKTTIKRWNMLSLKKGKVILAAQNFLAETTLIEVKFENLYRAENGCYWFNKYTVIA